MKKFFVLLMVALMLVSSVSAFAEPLQVSIVQLVENGAFKDMREGFIARMRELGYSEDDMVFTELNASGDMSNLYTTAQNVAAEEPDAVVTIATPASQALVNLESGLPVFFIGVSNPVGAGLLTQMEAPDKNATGASNAIPVSEMFKLADQLTPGIQRYGLIYCTSQVNSVTTIESAKAYLTENGLGYEEVVVSSSSEVYEAMNALCEKDIQGIFVPNDSVIQDAMEVVATVAKDNKLPVYGSSAVMVNSGAFATISISDTELGAIAADMLKAYLDGTPIAEIPAVTLDRFITVINRTTADAIGVTLADDLQAVVVE